MHLWDNHPEVYEAMLEYQENQPRWREERTWRATRTGFQILALIGECLDTAGSLVLQIMRGMNPLRWFPSYTLAPGKNDRILVKNRSEGMAQVEPYWTGVSIADEEAPQDYSALNQDVIWKDPAVSQGKTQEGLIIQSFYASVMTNLHPENEEEATV